MSSDEVLDRRIAWMRTGTDRLLRQAGELAGTDSARPSVLPGWTRGHVLAHVAQNATALVNLLTWARTGVVTPMYPSAEARTAAIETAATTSIDVLLESLQTTAAELDLAVATLPSQRWSAVVTTAQGREVTAAFVPWMRVREVWVHAVDLEVGATFADITDDLARELLDEMSRSVGPRVTGPAVALRADDVADAIVLGTGEVTREIRGTATDLVAWLSGRSVPSALGDPAGLPTLPAWL